MANKKFEKYLLEIIKQYIPILFLQKHTFEIKSGVESTSALFEIGLVYPYLNTKIYYSKQALKDWKSGIDMRPFVLHELCHCVTDPLYEKSTLRYVGENELNHERELLTDHICNIVLALTPTIR